MSVALQSIASPAEAAPGAMGASGRIARRLRLAGHVQGVGFRPFVYRLAHELELAGTVRNLNGEVEVLVSGPASAVERFAREVIARAPPLARPRLIAEDEAAPVQGPGFAILESAAGESARIFVPPDSFTCDACLAELADPTSRRYRYPFINCTQCGPRYTLIEALPYDRSNTTMGKFALCAPCREEYERPSDRRFHAEPVACAACGPVVWLEEVRSVGGGPTLTARGEPALTRSIELLLAGGILAVKGVGGYHLLCDATSEEAVSRLRARKRRPDKPLAVMFPQTGADGLASLRSEVELTELEAQVLVSPARPIVLARRRADSRLARQIAPGLAEVGVFLPYSPLHHLLLIDTGRPLVATSGNVSGEPVITDVAEARERLSAVADASLHHDRPIARPADDSVVRSVLGRPRTLRLGRGLAPLELSLPWRLERPVLATGGHLKTTIALAWEDRVVVSPHIADMGTARSERVFAQVAADLQRLYGVRATEVVCDAHPDYATTAWAERSGLTVNRVWHHHAHASAVAGEVAGAEGPLLVFAWDGTGLGADGTLWGGETFLGAPGSWRRVASLRPFRLPGGERAARAPWRSAAGVCWETGTALSEPQPDARLYRAWQNGVNAPRTSSVGRLFDAAAALVLGVREVSYEGQGPMRLEAAAGLAVLSGHCAGDYPPLPLRPDPQGLLRLDWEPLLGALLRTDRSAAERAAAFHATLAASIVAIARHERRASGIGRVAFTGGVFQNALLSELAYRGLTSAGFQVFLSERLPCNDGGLSYGQIIELAGRRSRGVAPC
ncbi:MAG TPA: carbamoyltransferase HypF [Steroidobacteraceae bacterium]|nr:carbamoyltransferase HypF [Steroidobacteraceae bacterium]